MKSTADKKWYTGTTTSPPPPPWVYLQAAKETLFSLRKKIGRFQKKIVYIAVMKSIADKKWYTGTTTFSPLVGFVYRRQRNHFFR